MQELQYFEIHYTTTPTTLIEVDLLANRRNVCLLEKPRPPWSADINMFLNMELRVVTYLLVLSESSASSHISLPLNPPLTMTIGEF